MAAPDMFIDLIRSIVREELEGKDSTEICVIQGYDSLWDKYSVSILPDRSTVIPNIINASKYKFDIGDMAVIYKMGNKLSNAFLIAKVNPIPNDN